jgi:YHS domain-containing protein
MKIAPLPLSLLTAATTVSLWSLEPAWSQGGPARPQTLAQANQTDVQKELQRLYEESGREMPELQQQFQQPLKMQKPGTPANNASATVPPSPASAAPMTVAPQNTAPQVVPNQGAQAGPGGAAPAASAPKPGSKNPVVSFFKRLVPGSQKPKPTQAPEATTRPTTPQVASPQRPNAPAYTPYGGQQPRRLPGGPATNNVVQQPERTQPQAPPVNDAAAPPSLLPPAPVDYPPTVAQTPPINPPAATAPVLTPPVEQPVFEEPDVPAPAKTVARPQPAVDDFNPFEEGEPSEQDLAATEAPLDLPKSEPVEVAQDEFAPPLMADDLPTIDRSQAVEVGAPPLPVEDAPAVAATTGDFPDPFPEMSEGEADDELDSDLASPFVGLKLDEEPDFGEPATETPAKETSVAKTSEPAAEMEDPFGDLPSLPEKTTPEVAAAPVAPELPLLEPPTAPMTSDVAATTPSLAPADTNVAATNPAEPMLELPIPGDVAKTTPTQPTLEPSLDGTPAGPTTDTPVATANPAPATTPTAEQADPATEAKMALIRERGGMKGLKGFCPVTLRDERELKDAVGDFYASFRGQKFHFATQGAKEKFEADPTRYVPAAYGADVVVLIRDKDVAEGSLDYAAWFKGKLYLFSTEQTHEVFLEDPAKYATPAGLE